MVERADVGEDRLLEGSNGSELGEFLYTEDSI